MDSHRLMESLTQCKSEGRMCFFFPSFKFRSYFRLLCLKILYLFLKETLSEALLILSSPRSEKHVAAGISACLADIFQLMSAHHLKFYIDMAELLSPGKIFLMKTQ